MPYARSNKFEVLLIHHVIFLGTPPLFRPSLNTKPVVTSNVSRL